MVDRLFLSSFRCKRKTNYPAILKMVSRQTTSWRWFVAHSLPVDFMRLISMKYLHTGDTHHHVTHSQQLLLDVRVKTTRRRCNSTGMKERVTIFHRIICLVSKLGTRNFIRFLSPTTPLLLTFTLQFKRNNYTLVTSLITSVLSIASRFVQFSAQYVVYNVCYPLNTNLKHALESCPTSANHG
jgi:hypothetical protein